MECPVCKNIVSKEDQKKCYICATDLEIFMMLEQLEKKARRQKRFNTFLIVALFLLAGAFIGYIIFYSDHDVSQQQTADETIRQQLIEIQTLTNEKQLLMTSNIELRRELEALTSQLEERAKNQEPLETLATPAFREITHVVKRGDNLKKLAFQYFGNTDEYVRIMRDNNISNPDHIRINQRLRIMVPVTD
jgi:flagellar basal body-associated protein FliL